MAKRRTQKERRNQMMNIVGNLIGPVTGLLDKVIEDKDQKAALAHEIATMSDQHAQQALDGAT